MGCAAAKPVVDRLEQQAGDRLRVIRVNIQDRSGRDLSERFGMVYTPTFILFDAQGTEVRRDMGLPNAGAVSALLERTV